MRDFRQFISQRTKDVSVACYIGRDCAIRDYAGFSVTKISKKEYTITSQANTSEQSAAAAVVQKQEEKKGGAAAS